VTATTAPGPAQGDTLGAGPGAPVLAEPCHRARGRLRRDGYVDRRHRGPRLLAHRIRWIEEHGPIPDGLDVLHHCDVRWCDEVTHLYLGTDLDNARDRERRGRSHNQAGAGNGNARLDPDKVRAIRAARGKVTQKELAGRYGVTQSHIAAVQLRLSWRDVEEER
jgi:HNH endonuclease